MESLSSVQRTDIAARARSLDRTDAPPSVHRLERGRTVAVLASDGTGTLESAGLAVTRASDDPLCRPNGVLVYLRDVEQGNFWSLGWQPTVGEPDEYEFRFDGTAASIRRLDGEIESTMRTTLTDEGVELRTATVINHGQGSRTIEVTSYLEWVLQEMPADAGHPAFSKLFVETEYLPERRMIVARRRQRDPEQQVLVGGHWIAQLSEEPFRGAVESESSRADFIGRGRDLSSPAALAGDAPLGGTFGPVLDPAASLRAIFCLAPGESATIVFATAGAESAEELLALVEGLATDVLDDSGDRELTESVTRRVDAAHTSTANGHDVRKNGRREADAYRPWRPAAKGAPHRNDPSLADALRFDNGLGGFTAAGDEYVIRLRADGRGGLRLPPLPWTHVVASPNAGFIATETGAGCTWTINSRENRLTHWSNDPVSDPPSEVIFLRDVDRGDFWSPLPGPAATYVDHEVRYGFGYARYASRAGGLMQETVQFVPREAPLKISRISLANEEARERRLELLSCARWALGNGSAAQAGKIETWFDVASGAVMAVNPARELRGRIAFAAVVVPGESEISFTGDRVEFVGKGGRLSAPAALRRAGSLSNECGANLDACGALQASLRIGPHETVECLVLLGEAESEEEARRLVGRFSSVDAADEALAEVRKFWRETLGAVVIDTPSPELNLMVNGWLPYQNLSCRIWGRSAYYQSGGAFGFRDQLQDAAAYIYHKPEYARSQILLHAASQFAEGDVLHWWHPPSGHGMRTRFADDLLWLPLLAAEYAATTGDAEIWDESIPYLAGPHLESGEAERYVQPTDSGQRGSLYEHCCRAIDRSLPVGEHGLPLMGRGDWNDGMSCIGLAGRGESVWMGFFLYEVLNRMKSVCTARGDAGRASDYSAIQTRLREALNSAGWDGQWFRRAYFDSGEPLGSAECEECQIDALVQAWAVLSGAGDADKQTQAIAAVEERLVYEQAGMIRLLAPPFDNSEPNPGYIRGYVPGVRENGGQYTHGVLWFIQALAELGRGTRAVELLEMLTPIRHTLSAEDVAIYQAEPYVVAADVYGEPPHVGRAGWTWYTGSAGWMFRVAVESILGLRIRAGRELVLNPTVSRTWPRCELTYKLPNDGGQYRIVIENSHGRECGVQSGSFDGAAVIVDHGIAVVPLLRDGKHHDVTLQL